jgi:hypothetical protein
MNARPRHASGRAASKTRASSTTTRSRPRAAAGHFANKLATPWR